mmetsp:Transcript_2518/g.2971  ORF Transcript_2518/g.2971 Transcript_2518/m.2971 type:complete len:458 (+) Transcript_2518:21-1394(+)|eukprot:CAMPEP_0205830972 /NCGR_PEP_ID=MMETSP0206-20130828/42640_1 /ASSEMBLY_ACC=CAM_ASM_000279 /TAXON_ID=36767 /ORGANISM="Euplotes focardii, Strain TN1" /LENGTH=457 /DNA_ID=CAMNT_0053135141 /DNA_START=22 /DNA_END=1395 /DNA_ORIENTATION=-
MASTAEDYLAGAKPLLTEALRALAIAKPKDDNAFLANFFQNRLARDVLPVRPAVQRYAWGKIGKRSMVAVLEANAVDPPLHIADEPYAELWMGTHAKAPSSVVLKSGEVKPLHELLGGELPYLFKVLSIARCLSIQAHPHKELAAKLHKERPLVYKDPAHKPEMACAVTEFEAMCGFRPAEEIVHYLQSVPELRAVATEAASVAMEAAVSSGDPGAVQAALKGLFTRVMTVEKASLQANLSSLVARLGAQAQGQEEEKESRNLNVDLLVLRLHRQYPGDVGVFCPYLLNCFRCQPGEAVFLPPDVPHAYLSGDIIEVMACSDNVVRAGCTPKLRDTDTLCSMLTYDCGVPDVLSGRALDAVTVLYQPPPGFPEFRVTRSVVAPGTSYSLAGTPDSPALALVYEGQGHAETGDGRLPLRQGSVLFLPTAKRVSFTCAPGAEQLVVYRCFGGIGVIPTN